MDGLQKGTKYRVKPVTLPRIEHLLKPDGRYKGKISPAGQGDLWAVYRGAKPLCATCTIPLDSPGIKDTVTAWEVRDLLGKEGQNALLCGYLCGDKSAARRLYRLWVIEGAKEGANRLVHCTPAHWDTDFEGLFEAGFALRGLRGLDGLAPHFIFVKNIAGEGIKRGKNTLACPLSDTKEISRLCEKGFAGVKIEEGKIIFTDGGDSFEQE